jgi:hypothetical protein
MTWFKVDDAFHSHPKVLATDPAALGLWVVAGSWSSANLTDGFVPDHVLPRLLPDAATLARALVTNGLWRKVRGGHQFHDWAAYQPTAKSVRETREKRAAAGRIGGLTSGKRRSKREANREANASARASPIVQPPTRPLPSNEGRTGAARAAPPRAAGGPDNPDWRTLPAYGTERDPDAADRARRRMAAVRAAAQPRPGADP